MDDLESSTPSTSSSDVADAEAPDAPKPRKRHGKYQVIETQGKDGKTIKHLFCEKCNVDVERGMQHCVDCNVCIYGWDHHCVFFSKCIGAGNFYYFV